MGTRFILKVNFIRLTAIASKQASNTVICRIGHDCRKFEAHVEASARRLEVQAEMAELRGMLRQRCLHFIYIYYTSKNLLFNE